MSQERVKPLKILRNIASMAFGVRSRKGMEETGEAGKFHHYVLGAVCFIALFLLTVNGLVRLILSQAG
ncbi:MULTISPECIES: DUF2970 domain-containing protein [Spongiibacter]|jgi:hypothetical protein|uniref:DUF2970 domain-containing protein n=1 Tax=Spongiibacter TaxID=630749 RepID=UPI0003B438EE|nr:MULTISPECIES: DUF2970 domain-containing protein [Spongiibacter]MBO6752366.1 DUF2970 domain-containing protein [Spongiibacter sp.]|tara:strand:- start:11157 stop:11360 length:204 start_codon:yes stop_codon:yes gene_type:complete